MITGKKVYAIVEYGCGTYAAHIEKRNLPRFGSSQIVSKAEYQAARASGTPSWGERETAAKMGR